MPYRDVESLGQQLGDRPCVRWELLAGQRLLKRSRDLLFPPETLRKVSNDEPGRGLVEPLSKRNRKLVHSPHNAKGMNGLQTA